MATSPELVNKVVDLEQHSISINIFGRKFPMRVEDSQERAAVEEAARMINEQISSFKALYATQDDLNIALMCCLKVTTDHVKQQKRAKEIVEGTVQELDDLDHRLAQLMKDS